MSNDELLEALLNETGLRRRLEERALVEDQLAELEPKIEALGKEISPRKVRDRELTAEWAAAKEAVEYDVSRLPARVLRNSRYVTMAERETLERTTDAWFTHLKETERLEAAYKTLWQRRGALFERRRALEGNLASMLVGEAALPANIVSVRRTFEPLATSNEPIAATFAFVTPNGVEVRQG